MTTSEFSDAFDVLLNSHNTQAAFGEQSAVNDIVLDEYEKSIFLTQALDIIVKNYFDKSSNSQNKGFDDDTERLIDFSSLITTANLTLATNQSSNFDDRGVLYTMPTRLDGSADILFILNELLITNNSKYVVVPISYSEYSRLMSKPYALPLKKQAWRLLLNVDKGFDIKTELILRWSIKLKELIQNYKIRYVRRPYPIVLINLPDLLSIEGYNTITECELNPTLHKEVLLKAVELAIGSKGGYKANSSSLG